MQFNDLLLVSTSKGKLDAIDPGTGDRKWRFPDDWTIHEKKAQKLQGIYSRPEVSGDTVFLADYNGWVYAFKPSEASSDEANQKPAGIFDVRSAVVGGIFLDSASDTLYVTTHEGRLFALNASDLKGRTAPEKNVRVQFQPFDAGGRIWTQPVASEGRVFFGTTNGEFFAIDARSGAKAWEPFKAGAALTSTPVLAGDSILIGGLDRHLYSIDTASGRQKWSFEASDWLWSKPLVDGSTVYVADIGGNVFAVGLSDGRPLWDAPFNAGGAVRSGPVLSDGNLVVANEDGEVYAVDLRTGKQVWGPVLMGTSLRADLLTDKTSSSTVYVAPARCTSEETAKIYYYKLNTSTRERQATSSVC